MRQGFGQDALWDPYDCCEIAPNLKRAMCKSTGTESGIVSLEKDLGTVSVFHRLHP